MSRVALSVLLCFTLSAAAGLARAQSTPEENDLREFRVGMPVSALPKTGYRDFSCAADPAISLSGWQDFAKCPEDGAHRHGVRFFYDDAANPMAKLSAKFQGTKVAGHPVLLTLLIGDDRRVQALRIETDPSARLYLRKKAFLFADQVKLHFGQDGWKCSEGTPSATEQPVGGVFYKEHCEKTTPTRHFVLDRALYRNPNEPLDKFVGGTQLLIELPSAS
ncbi:MAG: hypothetical protein K6U10_10870 [Acidobacteriia bacterium]|nr:hypothetical protein [Methyloceanibacter sp.]MCL6492303.1 hypothetical protein [Terriglobia bacterium]